MGILKRNGVWYMDFMVNGERVRESCYTDDKALAQRKHDEKRAEVWKKRHLKEKPVKTWADAAAQWLKDKSDKRTIDQDRRKLEMLEPKIGTMLLTEIDRSLVIDLVDDYNTPATKNRTVALIRAILRAAEREWEWIDRAPALKTYTENNKRKVRATRQEMERLLAALPEQYHGPFRFALLTGLRKSNVFGLRWDWVNLDAKTVWVEGMYAKNGDRITVPLSQAAIDLIKRYEGLHPVYVFGSMERVPPKTWKRAVAKAGLAEGFRWHDLRHVWASWHLDSGTSKPELMELGAWKTPSMVDRYATPARAALIQRAEEIGTILTQSFAAEQHAGA